jgi:hypothetical protein
MTDLTSQCPNGRMFYPKESKAYDKWVKTAGDNPMIMADVSFETFLGGWQAAMKQARCEYPKTADNDPT